MERPGIQIEASADLCAAIVHYVARTREAVVVDDTNVPHPFAHDLYITTHQPRSICCLPLLYQGQLSGVLYLENNLATAAFTPARLEVLELLSTQAAIALENATLYADLQQENAERKRAETELQRRADEFAALYEIARDLATQQDVPSCSRRSSNT